MAKKSQQQTPEQLEGFESALTRAEQFIEDNQKILTIIVLVILAAVAIFLGIKRFYIKPLENDAQTQMFVAEQYFERDSFNLALLGDGNYFGFLDIIDDYGITKSGNLAKYYAGISYLNIGEYDEAIRYLKKFNPKDKIIGAVALGAIGDGYIELGEIEKAIDYYKKAADYNSNDFTCPVYLMKAGYAYESLEEFDKALLLYKRIKDDYGESNEGRNIEKYIVRAEQELK